MTKTLFCNIRSRQFDQSSPVHPVSQSIGSPLSMTYIQSRGGGGVARLHFPFIICLFSCKRQFWLNTIQRRRKLLVTETCFYTIQILEFNTQKDALALIYKGEKVCSIQQINLKPLFVQSTCITNLKGQH